MSATRTMAAVSVPAVATRRYAASYLGHTTCSTPGCLFGRLHRGTCLPAPARDEGGAR